MRSNRRWWHGDPPHTPIIRQGLSLTAWTAICRRRRIHSIFSLPKAITGSKMLPCTFWLVNMTGNMPGKLLTRHSITVNVKNVIGIYCICPPGGGLCWRTGPWFMRDRDMKRNVLTAIMTWYIRTEAGSCFVKPVRYHTRPRACDSYDQFIEPKFFQGSLK